MDGTRSRLAIAFAITVLALMAVQPIAMGFATASSYTATTATTNNNVSADYFIAGIYESNGVTPVNNLIEGSFYYVESNGGFSVKEFNVGKSGIQLILDVSNHTMVGNTYTVTGNWTATSGVTPSNGSKITCYIGNEGVYTNNSHFDMYRQGDSNNSTSVTFGEASSQKLFFDIDLKYSSAPSNGSTFLISITIFNNSGATTSHGQNVLTLTLGTVVQVFDDKLEDVNADNPIFTGNGGNMQMTPDTNNPAGVYIERTGSNNHSIANDTSGFTSNGINLTVNIPAGTSLYVYVSVYQNSSLIVNTNVSLTLSEGNTELGTVGPLTANASWVSGSTVNYFVGLNGNTLTAQKDNSNGQLPNGLSPIVCSSSQPLTLTFDGDEGKWSHISAKLVPV